MFSCKSQFFLVHNISGGFSACWHYYQLNSIVTLHPATLITLGVNTTTATTATDPILVGDKEKIKHQLTIVVVVQKREQIHRPNKRADVPWTDTHTLALISPRHHPEQSIRVSVCPSVSAVVAPPSVHPSTSYLGGNNINEIVTSLGGGSSVN